MRKQSTAFSTTIEASKMFGVFDNRDKNKRSFWGDVKLWRFSGHQLL
jgi:hypothetical protein